MGRQQRFVGVAALAGLATWGCGGLTGAVDSESSGGGGSSTADGDAGVGGAQTNAGGAPMGTGGAGAADGAGGTDLSNGLDIPLPREPEPTWADRIEDSGTGEPLENDFPDPPADYAPPLPVGTPGWRGSTEPVCSGLVKQKTAELWADTDGVAALVSSCSESVLAPSTPCSFGAELWYNDGSGWNWLLTTGATSGLAGIVDGDLLVGGPGALVIGREGEIKGWSPAGLWKTLTFFGDGAGAAYVVFSGDPYATPEMGHLYRFDGSAWTPLASYPNSENGWGIPTGLTVLGGTAFMAGHGMLLAADAGADFEQMVDAPSGHHVKIAGFAPDDLWVGDYTGDLRHYDGASWTTVGEVEGEIQAMLAIDGAVYFVSADHFGRATQDGVEIIHTIGGARFTGLAGVSADEIFVSLLDWSLDATSCGGLQTFVYDGAEFHRF